MTENAQDGSRGLLESLTVLVATLVAIAHTRLDLLSTDLEEEREHLIALLVSVLTALFCLGVGVILAMVLLVAVFWYTHRLLVLGSLVGFFLTAGLAACGYAVYRLKSKPRLFAASLAELGKDREQLVSRS